MKIGIIITIGAPADCCASAEAAVAVVVVVAVTVEGAAASSESLTARCFVSPVAVVAKDDSESLSPISSWQKKMK